MFNFIGLNFFAVLLGILTNMIIGMLWYSKLMFGSMWLDEVGLEPDDIANDDAKSAMSFSIIPAVIMVLTLALVLQAANVETVAGGIIYTSIITIGFVGTNLFNLVLFEGRKIKLTLINLGYAFVALNVASIILVLWK